MKYLVYVFIFFTLNTHAVEIHFTFTEKAREHINMLRIGTLGNSDLYFKVKLINNNWFYRSGISSWFMTQEQWEDHFSMTLNCNTRQHFVRSDRFRKLNDNDSPKVVIGVDAENLTAPDLKIDLFNNHPDFRDTLPRPLTYKNITNQTKIFLTLDYNENGFFYEY